MSDNDRAPSRKALAGARKLVEVLRMPLTIFPNENPDKLLRLMDRAIKDPEGLILDLATEADQQSPEKLEQDTKFLSRLSRSPRRFIDEMKKEMPKGNPGRQKKPPEET